ncbi:MAG: hypothetical protein R3C15_15495 [Thermoleophilia bacterium]
MTENLARQIAPVQSLAAAARTATANGSSADLATYESAAVILNVGTITDGTHTPKLQESDDNSAWSDVAAADLQGAFAALASTTQQEVGYIGRKRYVRVVVTVAGATTGGVYGATIVRGHRTSSRPDPAVTREADVTAPTPPPARDSPEQPDASRPQTRRRRPRRDRARARGRARPCRRRRGRAPSAVRAARRRAVPGPAVA